jgi:hypothetical protein
VGGCQIGDEAVDELAQSGFVEFDGGCSHDTDLFRSMFTNPALKDVTVREYDVLDAPTAITALMWDGVSAVPDRNETARDARRGPHTAAHGARRHPVVSWCARSFG